jgi:hypothetical protein
VAESEGFEPPVPFRVHLISSPPPYPNAVSTEHTTYKEIKPFLSPHLYDFTGRHRENSDNSRTVDLRRREALPVLDPQIRECQLDSQSSAPC